MNHNERVALIHDGVPAPGGTWADFGAGSGAFTSALRALIGPDATLYAVDKHGPSLRRQPSDVRTIHADYTTDNLPLPPLDGALAANTLHFVRDQSAALTRLLAYIKPGGTLLIVEYDVTHPAPRYVPHPLGWVRCLSLLAELGLHGDVIGERTSPSTGVTMTTIRAQKRQGNSQN
ncbi:MAG: methyltransferase domain-containing protein [Chloroflexota bacterium]